MKTRSDPRHQKRVEIVKALFERAFQGNANKEEAETVEAILKNKDKVDTEITKNAPAWPIEQISAIDLAILRLAVWELLYKKEKEPFKAIVDEAVEIAKEYGNDSSASFINGVLGSVIKAKKLDR